MTGMVAAATTFMYLTRHKDETLTWFMENWGLYIGVALSVLIFLFGLSWLGTPWYDEATNQQLKAEHDRAEFDWRSKSPEERAIITAARRNESLQLTQILQNDTIIRNQKELKRK
jgi:hypothetical protein